jgi:dihydrofolate reductase
MIVAHDKGLGIGYEGKIPWQGKVPEDMRHFKNLTRGHTVIMGRKTYESIGNPLPERQNVVISRDPELSIDGVTVVNTLEEALHVNVRDELFIAGGGTIYELARPYANRLYVTKLQARFQADTFFLKVEEPEWTLVDYVMHSQDEKNEYNLEFMTYERRKPH